MTATSTRRAHPGGRGDPGDSAIAPCLTRWSPRSGGVPGGDGSPPGWTRRRARCARRCRASPPRDVSSTTRSTTCSPRCSSPPIAASSSPSASRPRSATAPDARSSSDGAAAIAALKAEILAVMSTYDRSLNLSAVPSVVLVVGVNGSGKTTTIGKLAYRPAGGGPILADRRRRHVSGRGDRPDAGLGGPRRHRLVAHQPGADPGAVVFDAIQAAQARRVDVVLVDTAGRLHTKVNLMAELGKIRRVVERLIPEGPQEVLLVVDATTGMNAMRQAFAFHETAASDRPGDHQARRQRPGGDAAGGGGAAEGSGQARRPWGGS